MRSLRGEPSEDETIRGSPGAEELHAEGDWHVRVQAELGNPRNTEDCQKASQSWGAGGMDSPSQQQLVQKEPALGTLWSWALGLQTCERISVCCLSPQFVVLCYGPQGTNTVPHQDPLSAGRKK